jgi:hypothetical protein
LADRVSDYQVELVPSLGLWGLFDERSNDTACARVGRRDPFHNGFLTTLREITDRAGVGSINRGVMKPVGTS